MEIFLFLMNCILLFPTLFCGIVIDDDTWVERWKFLKRTKAYKKMPIQDLIYQACYGAGVFNNSRQDHLFNYFINAINTVLVYKLTGSFFASLLWLFNPVNNQISIWLNGRRYALSIMFVLLAVIYKPLFMPLYLIAVFFHIIALPAILLIVFTKYVFLVPAIIYAIKLFAWKHIVNKFESRKSHFSKDNELQKIKPQKLILYIKSIGYYFTHIIMPTPTMYHEHLDYFGRYEKAIKKGYSFNKEFYKGLIIFLFLIYEIISGNLWAGWFLLFISQWSGICTVTMNIADRYCSLAGIGLMMTLNKYVEMMPYEYQIVAYTAFIAIYFLKYQRLFRAYRTDTDFFDYHIEINPSGVPARSIYAQRILSKEPEKSYTLIKDGLKYRPWDFTLLVNMAQIMFTLNRTEGGLKVLEVAEQYAPLGEEQECKEEFDRMRNFINRPKPNRKQRRKTKNLK